MARAVLIVGLLVNTAVVASGVSVRPPVTTLLEKRHRNVILQQFDLSCGAATLATLLQFQHGRDDDERTIALEMLEREEYRDSPERIRQRAGFSLLDLKRYVDRRALTGNGFGQVSFEDLLGLAPAIVPVRIDDYDHFVVFRGMVNDRVLLADPSWGNRVMPRTDFATAWTPLGELGRVAFVVNAPGGDPPEHALLPGELDFVMLR